VNFDQVRELLSGIEQGSIGLRKSLPPEQDDLSGHYGTVRFVADASWVLGIFFDCGGWDFIDHIIDPDENRIEYDDLPQDLKNYRPPEKVCKEIYGSPGYLGCHRGN